MTRKGFVMGWWGFGVLDGDTALDALDAAMGRLGVDEDTSMGVYPLDRMTGEVRATLRTALEGRDLGELLDQIAPAVDDEWGAEHRATYTQVLGALAMAAGVPLGGFADVVVAAAESDPAWSQDRNEERTAAMAELAAAVRSYDGTAVAMTGTPLFEQILGSGPSAN